MRLEKKSHVHCEVRTYILSGKSMMTATLLDVNVIKDNAFKVVNTLKISLYYLFCNFILSNKQNRFNKQKVC